jgi:hypothetical protein
VRTPVELTFAKIRKISASYELVIHIFDPLITQSSPSFFALVCRAKASDPETGSDKQNEPNYMYA